MACRRLAAPLALAALALAAHSGEEHTFASEQRPLAALRSWLRHGKRLDDPELIASATQLAVRRAQRLAEWTQAGDYESMYQASASIPPRVRSLLPPSVTAAFPDTWISFTGHLEVFAATPASGAQPFDAAKHVHRTVRVVSEPLFMGSSSSSASDDAAVQSSLIGAEFPVILIGGNSDGGSNSHWYASAESVPITGVLLDFSRLRGMRLNISEAVLASEPVLLVSAASGNSLKLAGASDEPEAEPAQPHCEAVLLTRDAGSQNPVCDDSDVAATLLESSTEAVDQHSYCCIVGGKHALFASSEVAAAAASAAHNAAVRQQADKVGVRSSNFMRRRESAHRSHHEEGDDDDSNSDKDAVVQHGKRRRHHRRRRHGGRPHRRNATSSSASRSGEEEEGRGRQLWVLNPAYSTGLRSVLVVRALFVDQTPDVAISGGDAAEVMANVTAELTRMSFGAASLNVTHYAPLMNVTLLPTFRAPTPAQIRNEVVRLLGISGVDVAGYQHVLMLLPRMGWGVWVTNIGLGSVLGSYAWINYLGSPRDVVPVVLHELGHNLGLGHASSVDFYSGRWAEYGDVSDLMGPTSTVTSSSGSTAAMASEPLHDFHAGYKHGLNWIPDAHVLSLAPPVAPSLAATSSGSSSAPVIYGVSFSSGGSTAAGTGVSGSDSSTAVLPYDGVSGSAVSGAGYAPAVLPLAVMLPPSTVSPSTSYAGALSSVTFRLRAADNGGAVPPLASTRLSDGRQLPSSYLAFRLPSYRSIAATATQDRFVYGSLRTRVTTAAATFGALPAPGLSSLAPSSSAANGAVTLTDTPFSLGIVGNSLIVDTTPFSSLSQAADSDLQPGQAFALPTAGGAASVLIEHMGWAYDTNRLGQRVQASDSVVLRTSYLSSDGDRTDGPGCDASGCRAPVASAGLPWDCNSVSIAQLTSVNDVATYVIDPVALTSTWSTTGGPVRLSIDTCGSGSGSVGGTEMGVFYAFPLAEYHSRASVSRAAPIPGRYSFNSTSGRYATCASVELLVQPGQTQPMYLLVAPPAGQRGLATGNIATTFSCTASWPTATDADVAMRPDPATAYITVGSGSAFDGRYVAIGTYSSDYIGTGSSGNSTNATSSSAPPVASVVWRGTSAPYTLFYSYGYWNVLRSSDVPSPVPTAPIFTPSYYWEPELLALTSSPDPSGNLSGLTSWQSSPGPAVPVTVALGCHRGAYFSLVSGLCQPCPAGAVAPEGATSATQCVCGPGSFLNSSSSSVIAASSSGGTSQLWAETCAPCPGGSFKAGLGNAVTSCAACPPGSTSQPGSTACSLTASAANSLLLPSGASASGTSSAGAAASVAAFSMCDSLWLSGTATDAGTSDDGLWTRDFSASAAGSGRVRYYRNVTLASPEEAFPETAWLVNDVRDASGIGRWFRTHQATEPRSFSWTVPSAPPPQYWNASNWAAAGVTSPSSARAVCVCPAYGNTRWAGGVASNPGLPLPCTCPPGQARDDVTGQCNVCPRDTYRSLVPATNGAVVQETCLQCPSGWFTEGPGSTTCTARSPSPCTGSGMRWNTASGLCEDVNECTTNNGGCSGGGVCVNTQAGHYCVCPAGTELLPGSQRDCRPCGDGWFSTGVSGAGTGGSGTVTSGSCQRCPPGYVSILGGTACGCPLGFTVYPAAGVVSACAPPENITLAPTAPAAPESGYFGLYRGSSGGAGQPDVTTGTSSALMFTLDDAASAAVGFALTSLGPNISFAISAVWSRQAVSYDASATVGGNSSGARQYLWLDPLRQEWSVSPDAPDVALAPLLQGLSALVSGSSSSAGSNSTFTAAAAAALAQGYATYPRFAFLPLAAVDYAAAASALGVSSYFSSSSSSSSGGSNDVLAAASGGGASASGSAAAPLSLSGTYSAALPDASDRTVLRSLRAIPPVGAQKWLAFRLYPSLFSPVTVSGAASAARPPTMVSPSPSPAASNATSASRAPSPAARSPSASPSPLGPDVRLSTATWEVYVSYPSALTSVGGGRGYVTAPDAIALRTAVAQTLCDGAVPVLQEVYQTQPGELKCALLTMYGASLSAALRAEAQRTVAGNDPSCDVTAFSLGVCVPVAALFSFVRLLPPGPAGDVAFNSTVASIRAVVEDGPLSLGLQARTSVTLGGGSSDSSGAAPVSPVLASALISTTAFLLQPPVRQGELVGPHPSPSPPPPAAGPIAAAGVFASLAFIALVALVTFLLYRRDRQRKAQQRQKVLYAATAEFESGGWPLDKHGWYLISYHPQSGQPSKGMIQQQLSRAASSGIGVLPGRETAASTAYGGPSSPLSQRPRIVSSASPGGLSMSSYDAGGDGMSDLEGGGADGCTVTSGGGGSYTVMSGTTTMINPLSRVGVLGDRQAESVRRALSVQTHNKRAQSARYKLSIIDSLVPVGLSRAARAAQYDVTPEETPRQVSAGKSGAKRKASSSSSASGSGSGSGRRKRSGSDASDATHETSYSWILPPSARKSKVRDTVSAQQASNGTSSGNEPAASSNVVWKSSRLRQTSANSSPDGARNKAADDDDAAVAVSPSEDDVVRVSPLKAAGASATVPRLQLGALQSGSGVGAGAGSSGRPEGAMALTANPLAAVAGSSRGAVDKSFGSAGSGSNANSARASAAAGSQNNASMLMVSSNPLAAAVAAAGGSSGGRKASSAAANDRPASARSHVSAANPLQAASAAAGAGSTGEKQ